MKKLLLSFAVMALFTACNAQKTLVLYYSETGTTKTVALELQKQLGAEMTFSHQMVRMIFVEQLYRACTIIKGEPYHHE